MCLLSSLRLFGGRKVGLVLLRTFWNVEGPADRVGRCCGGRDGGTGVDDNDGAVESDGDGDGA